MLLILIIIFLLLLGGIVSVFYALRPAKDINLSLPRSWRELSPRQLRCVAFLMLSGNTKIELLVKSFLLFNNIRVIDRTDSGEWLCISGRRQCYLTASQVFDFTQRLRFLTNEIRDLKPLPYIAGHAHIFPTFEGAPFKQWLAAEANYQLYLYSQREEFLDKLCAVFYWDYDLNFLDSLTERVSRQFLRVPTVEKFTLFLYYGGLKNRLSKDFPYIFRRLHPSPDSIDERRPPAIREINRNMLHALIDGDVTKTQAVLDSECWAVFAMLDAKARESDELKNRMSKMK